MSPGTIPAYPSAVIARVSWVFSVAGEAFLEKIRRLILAGESIEGVADKYSMPTDAIELANALKRLLEHHATGLFHLTQTSSEPVSWHRYAVEVSTAMHELGHIPEPVPVAARKMTEIPILRANRPIHTAMLPERIRTEHGLVMSDWKATIRRRLKAIS